jgi:hypothetical protein
VSNKRNVSDRFSLRPEEKGCLFVNAYTALDSWRCGENDRYAWLVSFDGYIG